MPFINTANKAAETNTSDTNVAIKEKMEYIMSIKTIALAAATVAALGSAASAANYFDLGENLAAGSVLELGLVRADADGVVEIYKSVAGEPGALIGTETVHAGANTDVRVNVGATPQQDVIALLKVNGQTVVQRDYNIVR